MRFSGSFRPPSFNELTPIVKNLLIINSLCLLAMFFVQNQFGIDLNDKLGLHFPASQKFQPYQIVTYMFMHANFQHLFMNMFALWVFGGSLENLWGSKRFLIYYLITGIGAAACHYTIVYFQIHDMLSAINDYIANPSLNSFDAFSTANGLNLNAKDLLSQYEAPQALQVSVDLMRDYKIDLLNAPNIVGASGAVFGILLGFGMLFSNAELYIYFIPIPIKAKFVVIGYGIIELYSGLLGSSSDNVAHFAHLGGMLFGFILIKYWQKKSKTFY
jgi:membrane associated rhomboid family serine protease